jgi:hypothetical protein
LSVTHENINVHYLQKTPVPESIDPVFVKTIPKCLFSVIESERFVLVFTKTLSINSGTGLVKMPELKIFDSKFLNLSEWARD